MISSKILSILHRQKNETEEGDQVLDSGFVFVHLHPVPDFIPSLS